MFFDRFDTDKYIELLEARKERFIVKVDEEHQNQGKGCLQNIQALLYFILLFLTIILLYRIA